MLLSLLKLLEKCNKRGLKTSVFVEPDLGNQVTAIAIEPSPETQRLCSSLPLALKNTVDKNEAVDQCIGLIKTLARESCHDHTPFRGPCVTCGSYDNYDTLPDPEEVIEELESLKK